MSEDPFEQNARHQQIVQAYARGWNDGDAAALLTLYNPDATLEDPVGTLVNRGLDAIRTVFERGVAMKARVEITGPVSSAGSLIAFPLAVYVVMDGKPCRIDAVDLFRLDDNNKIIEHRAIFNAANIHATESGN